MKEHWISMESSGKRKGQSQIIPTGIVSDIMFGANAIEIDEMFCWNLGDRWMFGWGAFVFNFLWSGGF